MDLTTQYTPVGYIIVNKVSRKFVGRDDASGGYPWESDHIAAMTIWTDKEKAEEYKNISGFKSHGSDQWEIKTLYYR